MVQDHLEPEFISEPQDRENVIVSMGVMMDDPFALEGFDQCFQFQITLGHLLWISCGLLDLGTIFLCLDIRPSHQRSRFRPGSRERCRSLGVGSIGHLQATHRPARCVANEQVIDLSTAPQLEVSGTTTDEMARARHLIDQGQAARSCTLDRSGANIDRIEGPALRLDRIRSIATPAHADVTVSTDQTRNDGLAAAIDLRRAGRDHHI